MNISTSLICCDLSDLTSQLDTIIEHENFNWLHLDFMDGHFVPRYGISPELAQSLRKRYGNRIIIDSHLMVSDPYSFAPVIAPYSDWYIFHYEATADPIRTLQMLRKSYPNLKIGLAFNILTSKSSILDVVSIAYELGYLDGVMFMGISPGVLGTDSFSSEVCNRIRLIRDNFSDNLCIFIDGACNFDTVRDYECLGANVCVSGSSMMFKRDYLTNSMNITDMLKTNISRIMESINA